MSRNLGPCKIKNCENQNPHIIRFRTFTEIAKNKVLKNELYDIYNYLEIGDQLCQYHYMLIVEAGRNDNNNKKRKPGEFEKVDIEKDYTTEVQLSDLLKNPIDDDINFNYWSTININIYENEVSLSNDSFDILINKIKKSQKKINEYEVNSIENLNQLDHLKKKIIEYEKNNIENLKQLDHLKKKLNEYEKNNIENLNQFGEKIELLSNILYIRQRQLNLDIELDPEKFKEMVEQHEPKLAGFFDELVNIFLPSNRSMHNLENSKKSLVGLCYLLSGLSNKFNNSLQLEIGLYLSSSGASAECIDVMARLGISVSYKTVERHKKKIVKDHLNKINKYFEENIDKSFCFNIDDFHSIHSYRNPDTTTLSSAHHLATCVSKTIQNSNAILAVNNGICINNPENIEDWRINKYLSDIYIDSLSKSYNLVKLGWQHNYLVNFNQFDRIELLTVHSYDDAIEQRRNDRSMIDCHLINLKELNLKNLDDYLNALKMITDIPSLNNYLQNNIIPIVADFPGQLFLRRAVTLLQKQKRQNVSSVQIPDIANNIVPLLGPLHVSLNMREDIISVHWKFFEKMFKSIFGKNKKFAEKPKPWRINLLLELARGGWIEISSEIFKKFGSLCKDIEYLTLIDLLDNLVPAALDIYSVIFRSGSCDQYVDTIFRLWTFALRWERKNYNKIPLAFLSDYFYWKDNKHPFYNTLQSFLVNFNDYYVENWHSRIRANTSSQHSAEAIISQAFVLESHNQSFVNTFKKLKAYPYKESTLDYLKNKASLFLIDYFHLIYQNLEKSKVLTKKKYYFATLNNNVDLKSLPAGYHTSKPPSFNSCDHCNKKFKNFDEHEGVMLICGHAYHYRCYGEINNKCKYCLEYYKKGVFRNVKSYLKRLEDNNIVNNILLTDETLNDENEESDNGEEDEISEDERISLEFRNALNSIKNW
jgi:hypothetical protein